MTSFYKKIAVGSTVALIIGSALGLGGCASIPKHVGRTPTMAALAKKTADNGAWKTPPITEEYGHPVVLTMPESLPRVWAKRKVSLSLNNKAHLSDLAAILGKMGISIFMPSARIADKTLSIPAYQGTVGDLLASVSRLENVFFIWDGHGLLIQPDARFIASIPQVKELVKKVKTTIGEMGAKDVSANQQAGTVYFSADPDDLREIKRYLASLDHNAALISLRVAVINVQLNNSQDTGIDWGALEAAASTALLPGGLNSLASAIPSSNGGGAFSAPPIDSSSIDTNTHTNSGISSGTSVTPSTGTGSAANLSGTTLVLTGSGAQLTISNPSFSFSGILQFLETYGKTSTVQNVLLNTLGGTPVELKNDTEVPYVSSIGVGGVGSGNSNTTVGTASTSDANSGIQIKLDPYYNYKTGLVTIKVKLQVDSVLGFNQLSAGSQLGNLTQPTTQDEKLTNIVQSLPGQTTILGGLRYKTLSDNKQGIPWLANHGLASKDYQLTDEQMIIVLRPTLTLYNKAVPQGLKARPIYENGHAQLQIVP
jgi:hypothetical protein